MKKLKLVTILLLVALMFVNCFLCGCGKNGPIFGEFGYKGIFLTAFARNQINATEAKGIISTNYGNYGTLRADVGDVDVVSFVPAEDGESGIMKLSFAFSSDILPSEELLSTVLGNYSSCEVTVKYYIDGSDDQKTKTDTLQGTDFKSIIERNEYQPFGQLVVKYIVCFPELIDDMEKANAEFRKGNYLTAPFNDIFTYHTGADGNIVIQTRDFAEIPASIGGGIGCSFRQDTEILYDHENKLTKWQTSLGIWTAAPEGTMKQGYILEVNFNWIPKT